MKALLALISLLFLAACTSLTATGPAQQLVGDWRYSDRIQSCTYSFQRDGSFTGEVRMRSRLVSQFSGRWSVKGQILFYRYLSDALGRIPAGTTDQDQLLEVTEGSFVIRAANGDQRRYQRKS
jgi:outer membrane biogenesis lipoprotein LolB